MFLKIVKIKKKKKNNNIFYEKIDVVIEKNLFEL